ncbi:MAG TPA: VanZ family protein [Gemmataceae bacterium]
MTDPARPAAPPPPPRRRRAAAAFAVLLLLWTAGLLTPLSVTQEASRQLGEPETSFYLSKLLHLGGYGFLAWLAGFVFATRAGAWGLLLLLAAHAGATEYLQQFVGRGTSLKDVGLDLAGVALGVAANYRRWAVLVS